MTATHHSTSAANEDKIIIINTYQATPPRIIRKCVQRRIIASLFTVRAASNVNVHLPISHHDNS
jgi:hypothetical protein